MYDGRMVFGFLVLLGFNVVFVIVAALLIALEVSLFFPVMSYQLEKKNATGCQ